MNANQQHSSEPWRNYAHEVVTDVMHSRVPNLSVAQRARDQAEEFHDEIERQRDVIRAQAEQIADLMAQREQWQDNARVAAADAERLREALRRIQQRFNKFDSQHPSFATNEAARVLLAEIQTDALEGGGSCE